MSSKNTIKYIGVSAPKRLCIYTTDEREDTLKFLNKCDEVIFYQKEALLLDLTDVIYVSAAASVLLFSMVSRAKFCGPYTHPSTNVRILMPSSPKVKGMFNKSGLTSALQCNSLSDFKTLIYKGNTYLTGNNPKKDGLELSNLICIKYKMKKLPNRLSAAISEGLLNILHHAYEANTHEFMVNRWWCCFEMVYDEDGNKYLQCIILDRGIGIPINIRRTFPVVTILHSEGELIAHAMKQDVTSTLIPGRGQGSEDMKHPVFVADNKDYMSILSIKGDYLQTSDDCKIFQHTNSVGGTIIEWRLAFNE